MEIIVNGARWVIRFARLRGTAVGWCYYTKRKILVSKKLTGVDRLDTIIHELLHAHHPQLSEESVTETATGIAEVLWELGYRD